MKKKYSFFLRLPVRVGMPVLAAACLTMAGTVSAAETAKPVPQKEAAAKPAPAVQPAAKAAPAAAKPAANAKPAAKPAPNPYAEIQKMRTEDAKTMMQKLHQADQLAEQEKYAEALKIYNEMQKFFADKTTSVDGQKSLPVYLQEVHKIYLAERNELSTKMGEMYFQDAKSLYSSALHNGSTSDGAEKAKQAKDKAIEARGLYYTGKFQNQEGSDQGSVEAAITKENRDFSTRIAQFIAACDKIIIAADFRSQSNIDYVDPNYENRQNDIDVLYEKAEKLYRVKQYTKARDLCEKIFLQDPFNQKAIRLLDKIYKKLYFYAELRAYNEMLRSDAETIWMWVPRIPDSGQRELRVISRSSSDTLLEKLSSWKIDVDFTDYDIKSAINKIREKSKEVDPQHVGVNFLPQGLDGVDKKITLQLNNTPINIVLDYLCKKAGVKWSTDKEMFVIVGTRIDDYETREIPLRNNVYMSITGKTNGEDGEKTEDKKGGGVWSDEGIKAGVEASVKKRAKVSDEDLRRFFVERGIPFDQFSTIVYNSKQHMLSVTNTRENLMKLEILARELDVENPLILIESKILEISLNDEEELGFDWTITHTNADGSSDFTMNSPLRSAEKAVGIVNDKIINNLNIVPNLDMGSAGKLNVYLTIAAVDRTDRVEILSTPKVVTVTGETATIKMVSQQYFPESWNEPDTSNVNGTSIGITPTYPEFGDATDVGIVFEVTPTISSNNKMVTLQLQPSVTDLVDWSSYAYDIIILPEGATKLSEGQNMNMNIIMPQISKREVATNVKVFDGQTMVIGGITVDKQVSMDDRYPILGDIPIIGRLFAKTATKTERANMLISVTPRLISGDGLPCNNNPPNGVPDFRR